MQMRGNFATPVWPIGLSGLTTDEDRQKVGGNFAVHQTSGNGGKSLFHNPASQPNHANVIPSRKLPHTSGA